MLPGYSATDAPTTNRRKRTKPGYSIADEPANRRKRMKPGYSTADAPARRRKQMLPGYSIAVHPPTAVSGQNPATAP